MSSDIAVNVPVECTYFRCACDVAHNGEVISRVCTIFLLAMEAVSTSFEIAKHIVDASIGSIALLCSGDISKSWDHVAEEWSACAEKTYRCVLTLLGAIGSVVVPTQAIAMLLPQYERLLDGEYVEVSSGAPSFAGNEEPGASNAKGKELVEGVSAILSELRPFESDLGASWEPLEASVLPEVAAQAAVGQDLLITKEQLESVRQKLTEIASAYTEELTENEERQRQIEALKNLVLIYKQESTDALDIAIAEARVSLLCGGRIDRGDGASGAIIIYDLNEKPIGVFKPKDMDVYAPRNPSMLQKAKGRLLEVIQVLGVIGEEFAETIAGKAHIAEEACYLLAAAYFPDLVLPTKVATLPIDGIDHEGSIQLYEPKPFETLEKAFGYVDYRYTAGESTLTPDKMAEKLSQEEFERAAIFHWLTGNCDCHAANVFLREDGKIRLIDGGWSMASTHAGGIFSSQRIQKLFGFKLMQFAEKLPHGEKAFSDSAKKFIERLFTEKKLVAQAVRNPYDLYDPEARATTDLRIARLQERLTILQTFSRNGIPSKFLAKLNTTDRVTQFLGLHDVDYKMWFEGLDTRESIDWRALQTKLPWLAPNAP